MRPFLLTLLLLPAFPSAAQETHYPERSPLPEASLYEAERSALEKHLLNPVTTKESAIPVFSSTVNPAGEFVPQQGVDYFPAALFLDNGGSNVVSGIPHDVSTKRYSDAGIAIDGVQLEHLTVFEIRDQYTVKGSGAVKDDFNYRNTYFLFKDQSGKTIASVYYVTLKVGRMTTEFRVVKSGVEKTTANTLLVTPNPADKKVTLSYTVSQAANYSLRILDMTGRTVVAVLRDQRLEGGAHSSELNLDLPAGPYLVILESGSIAPVSQKLIIR